MELKSNNVRVSHDSAHEWKSMFCTCCGHRIDFPVPCGKRFCEICNGRRRRRVKHRLNFVCEVAAVSSSKEIRFLTLTLPNFSDLSEGFSHLIKSFRRFRQRSEFRRMVQGGAFVVEATRTNGAWHVHLHAFIQGDFWPVFRISKLWKECSSGEIVYIQAIYGKKIVGYLTKYLTKSSVPSECMDEMEQAFRGKRMFNVFGSWHDVNKKYKPPIYHCPSCLKSSWIFENEISQKFSSYHNSV